MQPFNFLPAKRLKVLFQSYGKMVVSMSSMYSSVANANNVDALMELNFKDLDRA